MSKAMKTIRTTIVTVTRDVEKKEDVKHAPGEPVTLPADEADSILARFGGEEVESAPKQDAAAAKAAKIAELEKAVADAKEAVAKAADAEAKKAAEAELKKAEDALAAAKK
jgi:anthranilate phosphoribosyltransferase